MERYTEVMLKVFELARKGEGYVEPNPMVGAVIIKDGKIISEGFHAYFGGPHAEVVAIRNAKTKLNGATLFVNLEPCSTYGKTPPCTPLIISSGIKEVVISNLDPNPKNHRQGVKILKDKGIKVITGILEKEGKELNRCFFKLQTKKRPYVIAKWAMSLDGKITSKLRWITSKAARNFGRKNREKVNATIIGKNTLLQDDPQLLPILNNRKYAKYKRYYRIILDSNLETPSSGLKIFANKNALKRFPVIIYTTENGAKKINKIKKFEALGNISIVKLDKEVIKNYAAKNKVSIENLLKDLYNRNIAKILVEGGTETLTSFYKAKVIDELWIYVGNKIIADKYAKAPIELIGNGNECFWEGINIELKNVLSLGNDVFLQYYV